ncbi:MAG: hypothetical protein ACI85O_000856 [Saprospiraceae bacterium]|jgi:hypothetical protein
MESCAGNDGTATASVSGATGAVIYAWNNGATSANISGLSAGTYYVTATDANGCEATTSTEVTAETGCDPYCISSGESTQYEWIDNVHVEGADNLSGDNGGYANFTNIVFQGTSGFNNITLTPGFSGNNYREYWRVWIDFNQDGDFNDSGELVLQRNSPYAFNDYFYIPTNVLSGQTRMRVSMKFGSYAHPCEVFAEGEVEDYTIDISICDNLTDGGVIADDETLCPDNNDPAEMVDVVSPSGGSGAIEYVWLMNTNTSNPPPAAGWSEIAGSNAPTYDSGTISQTTWYIRCARRAGCTEYWGESNVVEKTFVPNCNGPEYCESAGLSTDYEWIKRVKLHNVNNYSGDDGGYGDYTNLVVNLNPGQSKTIVLRPGFSGSSYREYWRVWVDWNQDGDFDDTGELEGQGSGFGAMYGTVSVPSNAAAGHARMRISMKYGGYADYCGSFGEGEVEDYTINVGGSSNFVINGDDTNARLADQREDTTELTSSDDAPPFEGIEVQVYPNPAKDVLNVNYQIQPQGDAVMTIMDVTGRVVYETSISNDDAAKQRTVIQVSQFAKGAYFLKINSNRNSKTVKFFKF